MMPSWSYKIIGSEWRKVFLNDPSERPDGENIIIVVDDGIAKGKN